jgi:hypothetical protein
MLFSLPLLFNIYIRSVYYVSLHKTAQRYNFVLIFKNNRLKYVIIILRKTWVHLFPNYSVYD